MEYNGHLAHSHTHKQNRERKKAIGAHKTLIYSWNIHGIVVVVVLVVLACLMGRLVFLVSSPQFNAKFPIDFGCQRQKLTLPECGHPS